MTYQLIYSTERERDISACIMDGITLQGFDALAYVDSQINLVPKIGGLVYKICTLEGNMVGVLAISVTNMGQNVVELFRAIRPNYQSVISDVNSVVTNFLNTAGWRPDFLL